MNIKSSTEKKGTEEIVKGRKRVKSVHFSILKDERSEMLMVTMTTMLVVMVMMKTIERGKGTGTFFFSDICAITIV